MGHHYNNRAVRLLLSVALFVVALNGIAIYNYFDSQHALTRNEATKTTEDRFQIRREENAGKFARLGGIQTFLSRKLLNTSMPEKITTTTRTTAEPQLEGLYPKDSFTMSEKRAGWVVLHVVGVCYTFLALAIICDEFFVPALHVITTKMKISDDVAGATFMAAGGSAPEFFTSCIGVFIAQSNVGFGTIVGSAVFNVLFVIGMCAVFSKVVLNLTWWPLFRDCTFYVLALGMLIFFFKDTFIEWYEALALFIVYLFYVIFMTFNQKIEKWVKNFILNKKSSCVMPLPSKEKEALVPFPPSLTSFRHGALQLVIHTLDPIAEVTVQHKFEQILSQHELNKVDEQHKNGGCVHEEVYCEVGKTPFRTLSQNYLGMDMTRTMSDSQIQTNFISKSLIRTNSSYSLPASNGHQTSYRTSININEKINETPTSTTALQSPSIYAQKRALRRSSLKLKKISLGSMEDAGNKNVIERNIKEENMIKEEEKEGEEEQLDLSWPTGTAARIYYVIKAPILFILVCTVPDVRRASCHNLFPISFVMSIAWISVFSFLMVWWAAEIGFTIGIDDEVMGLTFLAAGTSIPDLITSLVVARQGLGDMAVSSSIGSNIFDVTVGLPLPWLIKSLSNNLVPVAVISKGLFCSTTLLFVMLLATFSTIAVNKWRMTRLLGGTMFLLYIVFIVLTLLMQLNVFQCPL